MTRKVLLGPMSCYADFGNPNLRYQKFLSNGRPRFKHLIESLILFDQVVIPTNDFMPLSLILGVLGEDAVISLLDSEAISFARYRGGLIYAGGGVGVSFSQLSSPESIPKYFSAPSDEAIRNSVEGVHGVRHVHELRQLAGRMTTDVTFGEQEINQLVAEEVKNNQGTTNFKGKDLRRLPGIAPDQIQTLNGVLDEGQTGDIADILRVAEACVEARAASTSSVTDIYTSEQVAHYFTQTAQVRSSAAALMALQEIGNLPDAGEQALQSNKYLKKIIALRQSSAGAAFRSWFHAHCVTDPMQVAKEYADLLKQKPITQSRGGRAIRFFAQLAVGAAGTILDPLAGFLIGGGASVVDSFIVDAIAERKSPKIFIEKLRL